jgi:hypothetical protein
MSDAFWIDYKYDRSSDGRSRYSSYLRDRRKQFEEIDSDDKTAAFAATAWRIANSPIMAPGYVRRSERILSAELNRSYEYEDGALLANIEIAVALPSYLRSIRPPAQDGAVSPSYYADWPHNYAVYEEDPDRGPYLLTKVKVLTRLPARILPLPGFGDEITLAEVLAEAPHFVSALVTVLNGIVNPILAA